MRGNLLVMCLIVLVPLVPSVHTIEVSRLPRSVLVFPVVRSGASNALLHVEQFLLFVQLALGLCAVQCFREVSVAGSFHFLLLGFSFDSLRDEAGTRDIPTLL